MNPIRKRRLIAVALVTLVTIVAVLLILKALEQNLNLYFTPTEVAEGKAARRARIRIGGLVEKGSVIRGPTLQVDFAVTDFRHRVKVHYVGILPDLFKEGQGIVVLGSMNALQECEAIEVLAKHDENYKPPEVKHP